MRAQFKVFRSQWETWEAACERVSEFASEVGPARLISITHSEANRLGGTLIVWYWDDGPGPSAAEPFGH